MARNYIVADVGGTHIRVACFPVHSQKPSILKRIATVGPDSPHDRLLQLIATVTPKDEDIAVIAVAAPGPLDPFAGIVYEAPNIPSWINLPLRKLIEDRFHVPVAIGNDANLAALGEWRFGAGVGHRNLVYVTVSTGIGGGVIIENQLLLGARGLAAELGHLTIIPDGPLCGCGQRGHLEAVAAGPAIAAWVEQELSQGIPSTLVKGKPITAKDVSKAAKQGDELAKAALARSATFIGTAIADYLHIFNPSMVIIGGGVSQSGDNFLNPLRTAMNEHVMSKKYLDDLILTTSALGDDVGLMGALALAHTIEQPTP
ncbi:MAG TPA: ROK family protein [Anaerolineales bacterium]|nr:ROK family protein [Anaerolineales bacterium]